MIGKSAEASQPPLSSSTTSDTFVVEEVHQAIRAELTKNLKNLGIGPSLHDGVSKSESVIGLITPSNISPALSQPSVIPRSPIAVASTPSRVGNGGSAPGFSHLSHMTNTTSPAQMFVTTHWKPKEPLCFFGRSTEDIHTWTSMLCHYLAFMASNDA